MAADGQGQSFLERWVSCPCPTAVVLLLVINCHAKGSRREDHHATYTAFEWSAVDVISIHLADCHGCILVGIHLDKGEAAVGLESRFDNESKVLEKGNHVIGGGIGCQIAHIASSLPVRSLVQNHIVTAHAVSRELMVTKGSRGSQAHSLHRLLLCNGRLPLLVGPVASNSSRAQPLAIHRAQCLFSI